MQIVPTGCALGAEIASCDLRETLSADAIATACRALLDHLVIFFRNQKINEVDQVRFTNYFARAVEHVRNQRQRRKVTSTNDQLQLAAFVVRPSTKST